MAQQHSDSRASDLFYQKVNETIRNQTKFQLYTKRVDCIINDLKTNKAIDKVNASYYDAKMMSDGGYNVVIFEKDAIMIDLQPLINDANFSCTIIGYSAVILIISVLFIVLICVACLNKKRL